MATIAGNIWQTLGHKRQSCFELISQFRGYTLNDIPFNLPYLPGKDTPLTWWQTCYSSEQHLQELAIRLFSITPNAASCERIWSSIGWFYGKRRTRLSTQTIESLSKIHRFYITNAQKEMNYSQSSMSNQEIIQMVQESLAESYEEPVEDDDDELILACLNEPDELNVSRTRVKLGISELFNLELITRESNSVNSTIIEEVVSDDELGQDDFSIDELVNSQFYQ